MFSKFRSVVSGSNKASNRPKSQSKRHSSRGSDVSIPKNSEAIAEFSKKEMRNDVERDFFNLEVPTQQLGLSDLISNHKPGTTFQYVAITGKDSETFEARLSRLRSFKPTTNHKRIPSEKLPTVELHGIETVISLGAILPKKNTAKYVRVSGIMGYFSSTMATFHTFTKVRIAMMDGRFHPPVKIQSATVGSNMDSKFEISMEFCVPVDECGDINFIVAADQELMPDNRQWGAIQAQVELEFMDFPQKTIIKPVNAVLAPNQTILEDLEVDPNNVDITLTEIDRKKLKEMYINGEIIDEGEPIVRKSKANTYSKSTVRGASKSQAIEGSDIKRDGWEHTMGMRKPLIDADQVSEDPDDERESDGSDYNGARATTADAWKKEQERLRLELEQSKLDIKSDTTEEIPRNDGRFQIPMPIKNGQTTELKSAMRKGKVNFATMDV